MALYLECFSSDRSPWNIDPEEVILRGGGRWAGPGEGQYRVLEMGEQGRGTQRPSRCEQLGDLGEVFLHLF